MRIADRWVIPLFLVIVLGGAALLGPVLYAALALTIPVPFHRAMDRALLLSAVAALALFWPRVRLHELWPLNIPVWRPLLLGYLVAFVSAQAMIGLDLALAGFSSAHLSAGKIAGRVALALTAALLVPPLEETIFRGFVLVQLRAVMKQSWAWFLAALIFMTAHFLKIPAELDHRPVHAWSGITALGAAFAPLARGEFLAGHGLNLLLIGLILGGTFLRSGTLWFNAGLHSGWIFVLLLFTGLTRPAEPARISYFGGDLLASPATTVVLLLLSAWLWRYYHPPATSPDSGANAR
jgi:membrane protease YdiL (CAAX protease family)